VKQNLLCDIVFKIAALFNDATGLEKENEEALMVWWSW
jgi:hypothetical protein